MEWVNLDGTSLVLVVGGLVLVLGSVIRWYRLRRDVEKTFVQRLRNYPVVRLEPWVQAGLFLLMTIFLGVALWGPGWGVNLKQHEATGVDVLFVQDVSLSMKAEDLSKGGETQDRLTAAKEMIASYVLEQPENRYGLVIFAGEAFVTSPLTLDTNAFLTFVETIDYSDVGEQGTDLVEAVSLGLERLDLDSKRGKVLVLISDGGDEEITGLDQLVERAKEQEVRVVGVGIGNDEGVPIPEGKDVFGRSVYKTYQGERVLTRLNEAPLKELAEASGGTYFQADSGSDLDKMEQVLNELEKTSMAHSETAEVNNQYQLFLWPVLLGLGTLMTWPLVRLRRKDAN